MQLHHKTAAVRPGAKLVCRASQRGAPCPPPKHRAQPRSAAELAGAAAATTVLAGLMAVGPLSGPAFADLNRFEFEAGGEFGQGSAQQYGEADVEGRDFSNQDLRRSNFTSANCKRTSFKNSNLQGAYFMKSVLYLADFSNANLSDTLMDRAVLVEADLTGANLERAVLTRSDLRDAKITGADFTNALVDKLQQQALCRYADGTNPITGVETRKSLGCGSMRRFRASSPSNPDGPQPTQDEKDAFRKTLPKYYE